MAHYHTNLKLMIFLAGKTLKRLSKYYSSFHSVRCRNRVSHPFRFSLTVLALLAGLFLSPSIHAQTQSNETSNSSQKGGVGALGSGGVSQKDEELRDLLNARRPKGKGTPHESVATTQRINAHFASLPPLKLPCDDVDLIYFKQFAQYSLPADSAKIQKLQKEYRQAQSDIKVARKDLSIARDDLMLAGYAYYRAQTQQVLIDIAEASLKFKYAQGAWLWNLMSVTKIETGMRTTSKQYYHLVAPHFSLLKATEQTNILNSFDKRLACFHKERPKAFKRVFETEKIQLKDLLINPGEERTAENTAGFAAIIAKQTGDRRSYAWLVAESANLTGILTKLISAHQWTLTNLLLHPKIEKAHKELGVALGPSDPLPPDPEARRIRLKISQARMQLAVNYLYLKQVEAEAAYKKQLNVYTGGIHGFARLGEETVKAAKNIWKTKNLIKYNEYKALDPVVSNLSIVLTATEFFGSSLSILLTGPLQDFLMDRIKPVAGAAGFDLQNSADQAFAQYQQTQRDLQRSLRLMERIKEQQKPGAPEAFELGQALIDFIITGRPSKTGVTTQAPQTIRALLEDPGFIRSTGGGFAYMLEPLCESPARLTALHVHAGRHALTGSAREAWQRIALDRGITVENKDAPLTQASLKGSSLSDFVPDDNSFYSKYQKIAIKVGGDMIYSIPLYSQFRFAYDNIPLVRAALRYEGRNEASQDSFLQSLIIQQERYDRVLKALNNFDYDFHRLQLENWEGYLEHTRLVSESADYSTAYLNIRGHYWMRSKYFSDNRYSELSTGKLTAFGKAELVFIDKAHELEVTDLVARIAHLKVEHHAMSINYLATAEQLKSLQNLENERRRVHGISGKVDLTSSIEKFENEARLSELTVAYKNLVKELIVDVAMEFMTLGIGNAITSLAPSKWGLKGVSMGAKNLGDDLIQAVNPWAGKFSEKGVWAVVENGAVGTLTNASAQIAAKQQNLFTYNELNGAFDKMSALAVGSFKQVRGEMKRVTLEAEADEKIVKNRLNDLFALEPAIKSEANQDLDILRQLRVASAKNDQGEVQKLHQLALKRAKAAALDKNRQRYRRLMDGIQDVYERRLKMNTDINNVARSLPVAELLRAKARHRIAEQGSADKKAVEQAAQISTIADFQQLLKIGVPTSADLKRLVDDNDPLSLSSKVLRDGLDIQLVRDGLRSAIARAKKIDDKEELKRIGNIAAAVDEIRIQFVNKSLNDFFNKNPLHKAAVLAVMQGGRLYRKSRISGDFCRYRFYPPDPRRSGRGRQECDKARP